MRFKPLLIILLTTSAYGSLGYEEPWGKDTDLIYTTAQQASTPPKNSLLVRAAHQIIRFHQNVLSPVDGPRSHFRPSSSQYMLLAMQKHGFVEGFVLGCDRLLRENHTPWVYRTIEED